jgi:hypothetical protein
MLGKVLVYKYMNSLARRHTPYSLPLTVPAFAVWNPSQSTYTIMLHVADAGYLYGKPFLGGSKNKTSISSGSRLTEGLKKKRPLTQKYLFVFIVSFSLTSFDRFQDPLKLFVSTVRIKLVHGKVAIEEAFCFPW